MSKANFDQLADDTLLAIEEAIDESGADIDYDDAGGILTLEFENGSRIIVNKQGPLSQIWVAARSGGYHFDYDSDDDCWRLAGNGEELFSCLSRYCSEQAGSEISLQPPA